MALSSNYAELLIMVAREISLLTALRKPDLKCHNTGYLSTINSNEIDIESEAHMGALNLIMSTS